MITGMPRIAIAVRDFDKIVATFRDQFGMPVIDFSDSSVASLGAKLGMCVPPGGSNIELMCPENPEAPLSQSLQRFLDRRGEGLFALMLEAPVPDEEAQRLLDSKLNVLPLMAGAGGRDIHPNSTHGVLIRVYPVDSFQGKMATTQADLGLSGIARVVVAVKDLDHACGVYGAALGLRLDPPTADEIRGVHSVMCHPPTGGLIELVAVRDAAQPYARRLEEALHARGEGMFELVLQTRDVAGAARELTHRGLSVTDCAEGLQIATTQTYGAQISIESF